MSHLFVYGTLMRGEERDGFVSHLDARQGSIMGRLWRAPAGYPALELTNQGTAIAGEILALDTPSILIALDLIEGVNEGLYDRVEASVKTDLGHETAWVYVMNSTQLRRASCILLKGNDWRKFSRKR